MRRKKSGEKRTNLSRIATEFSGGRGFVQKIESEILCFERVLSPEEIRLAADRTPALL
jgi:hypothetical protein